MNRKFLVTYAFMDSLGAGHGNVFASPADGAGLTEATVLQWQEMIRRDRNAMSVTILGIIEMEG